MSSEQLAANNSASATRNAISVNNNISPYGMMPGQLAVMQGQNLAAGAISDASQQAGATLQNTLQSSLGYLGAQYQQAQSVIAPNIAANSSALDAYFTALGIATPQGGFGAISGLKEAQSVFDSLQADNSSGPRAGTLNSQLAGALSNLNAAKAAAAPQSDAQASAAQQGVLAQLQNSPGYQFAAQNGLNQIQQNAASAGYLNSGRTLAAAQTFETGLADQTYQNYVNNLAQSVGLTNPFVAQSANLYAEQGNTGASITSQLGMATAADQQAAGANLASIYAAGAGGQSAASSGGGGAGSGSPLYNSNTGGLLANMVGRDTNPTIYNSTYYSNQGGNGLGGVSGFGG